MDDMREKAAALRERISAHLGAYHDGSVLHTILSALDLVLTPPETRDVIEAPAEPVDGEGV